MKFTDYESWKKMSTEEKKELLKEAGVPMESEEGKTIADIIDSVGDDDSKEIKGWTPECADCTYERCPSYKDCSGFDPDPDVIPDTEEDEDERDMEDSEYDSEEDEDDEESRYEIAERDEDVPICIQSSDQRVERMIINRNGEQQLIAANSKEELDKIEQEIADGKRLTDGLLHHTMFIPDRGIYVDCTGETLEALYKDIQDAKNYFGIE